MKSNAKSESPSLVLMDYEEYATAIEKLLGAQRKRDEIEQSEREIESLLTMATVNIEADQTGKTKQDLRTKLRAVRQNLYAAREAITLAEERVETARRKIGSQICEALKPKYLKVFEGVISAVDTLNNALIREARFFDQLRKSDVATINLVRMPTLPCGTLNDENSDLTKFVRHCITTGLLSELRAQTLCAGNLTSK